VFTGLVECTGKLIRRTAGAGGEARLSVGSRLERLVLGESISVDGVCLTVDKVVDGDGGSAVFECDASRETLAKTTLGALPAGTEVNLERAMALGDRMGGHIVSGHVDGKGTLAQRSPAGTAIELAFAFPADLGRFIAQKGSICVNGVSLTVNAVDDATRIFAVMIIPHTQSKTSLGRLAVGDAVNLEVDLVARYVARLLDAGRAEGGGDASLIAQLKRSGYM
jgi:riboflavin synthase